MWRSVGGWCGRHLLELVVGSWIVTDGIVG